MSLSVGITMAISLILRMALPRVFGPEKMGVLYFAESFSNLFFTFLPLGLTTYINRTVPARPAHTGEILNTILVLEAFAALFIGILLWGSLIWTGHDTETIRATLIMGGYAAFFIFQKSVMHAVYIAHDEFVLISRLNIIIKVVLVLSCLLCLWIWPSVSLIATMYLLSELCGFVFLLWISKKRGYLAVSPDWGRLKQILKISLPFYLAGVLNGVYSEIDTTMLAQLANHKEVGYFGAAYKLIGVFLMMIPIIHSAFTPALSRALAAADGSFLALAQQLIRFLLIASLPLSMGLIIFGDHIARILYGDSFAPSFKVICYLSPVLTMMYLNTFMAICMNLSSSGRKLAIIFVFGILLNIGLDSLFIPWGLKMHGEGGAALGVSFATFLCELYSFIAMICIFPGRMQHARLAYGCLAIFLPCWLGMYFYDDLVAWELGWRVLLALSIPIYAFAVRVVTLAECKSFIELFRQGRGAVT